MTKLTKEIILHIFDNFGVLPDSKKVPILSDDYILTDTIIFEGEQIKCPIWGAEIIEQTNKLRVLVTNCAPQSAPEYCLLVQLNDNPAYACYYSFDDNLYLIAYHFNNNFWSDANFAAQASLLLALEQVKDLQGSWQVCSEYVDLYQDLKSFIEYTESVRDERA